MRKLTAILTAFGIYFGIFGISAAAQTGGQFCVRSFQDLNGNGVLDAETEPLLTRGVGLELLDEENVVIASALLERSPNAADGVVCFQNLVDGTYSVMLSSADYNATTSRLVSREVSSTGLPVVIEFGAQRATGGEAAPAPSTSAGRTPEQMQSMVLRLSLSTVGTVLIVLIMLIIGVFIYVLRGRGNNSGPGPVTYRPDSVRQLETEPYAAPPAPAAADTGRVGTVPPASLEDTGPVGTVSDDRE